MSYIPINWKSSLEKECKRRGYSPKTIKTYTYCIERFLRFTGKGLDRIGKKDVRLFLETLSERERSGSTMNVYHMAIRFLFQNVLDKRIWINISYSKVPEKIPAILAKDEIKKLFESIENQKHRLMIEFLYSSGLRVSELVNLTVKDLNIENSYGWVRRGKGNKDRLFILAESLKTKMHNLITEEKLCPEVCLFSNNKKMKYNISSLQKILEKASRKSKIGKRVSPHALRHSFATHLIENGYSVSEVQGLLGHKSPETTLIYLHTSAPTLIKVKSPIDQLYNEQNNQNFQTRQPVNIQNNPQCQNKAQNNLE
ncbi:MAG: tyrosine-type recombinase/integrase [Candidatus Aenigmarchaeota archaeon]|nr:tyrosine-type recombinase/integrase [Candidatus Aenigmarchaeota archaeon]